VGGWGGRGWDGNGDGVREWGCGEWGEVDGRGRGSVRVGVGKERVEGKGRS